jgi:hypothetical protein
MAELVKAIASKFHAHAQWELNPVTPNLQAGVLTTRLTRLTLNQEKLKGKQEK